MTLCDHAGASTASVFPRSCQRRPQGRCVLEREYSIEDSPQLLIRVVLTWGGHFILEYVEGQAMVDLCRFVDQPA